VLTAMFSVLLSLFTEETKRYIRSHPSLQLGMEKKIMAVSLHYQVLGAIGISTDEGLVDLRLLS
jgi:hypothetical protein